MLRHMWNMSGRLRKGLTRPSQVDVFPWEQGPGQGAQSLEEMKSALYSIAQAGKRRQKTKQ